MPRLQEQILAFTPAGIRAFIEGSSRRDLLRKVSATLVVFDQYVGHLESGSVVQFQEEPGPVDATSLAQASRELLGPVAGEASVLLLLPPSLFVATRQRMAGIGGDSIVSALLLQADSLLPANESRVALAINPKATELTDEPVALWVRESTMAGLFNAFADRGLFVAAVKPRLLHLEPSTGRYIDSDASTLTLAVTEQNVLLAWLQTQQADLEQAEFARQWQDAVADPANGSAVELNAIDDYLELASNQAQPEYSFFPPGALQARKQLEKGRKLLVAAAIAGVVLFLSSIPFLLQSLQFRSLAATLESQRELSFEARQDQAVVVAFEDELGPIDDFPEQRVRDAMFSLQNALSPNRLSSLEITKGVINIQGSSAEPQSILQRLEQDPMFTEVSFSRATNNDRYYISLRLSTVNFEGYMVRYFPD